MADPRTVLTQTVAAQLPTGRRVTVIARYDAHDPLVLRLHVVGAGLDTDALLALDLLAEALLWGDAGHGDVRFRADHESNVDSLWLVLDSFSGHAELRFATSTLADLEARLHHLVPGAGCHVDLDAELRLLAEGEL
jgi:hypothetical protein